jgi:protein TonB
MSSRITSACLAISVHAAAVLLLLAVWHAPEAGMQGPVGGAHLTTVSVAAAPDEASEPQPKQETPAREAESVAEPVASQAPSLSLPSLRPVVSQLPLPRPVQLSEGGGKQGAESPNAASAAASPQASVAASDDCRPDAASAASETSAPARSSTGSNSYAVKVFRHILRKKEFPSRLAQAGIRGRVLVRFNLTGAGEVIDILIVKSSGVAALDGLALEQIRGAVPYPRPPKELSAAQLHFLVPMTYRPST